MALAAAAGGIKLIEIAWNTDRAESLIPKLQQELPDCKIGTGTILDISMAERAITCGCSFLFTPHTNSEIIAKGIEHNIPVIAGALTPTEIITAWQAGAAAVKVFPARALGPNFIKDVREPLPFLKLMPTGGIGIDNIAAYLQAGAFGVGVGGNLVDKQMVAARDWAGLYAKAQAFIKATQ